MADLVDIGGGFKQFTGGGAKQGSDPLDQAHKILSLQDLSNRISQAPLEQERLKNEVLLKQNEVIMAPILNEQKRLELIRSRNTEQRDQVNFVNNSLLNIRQGFQQSFELGAVMLQQALPGASAQKHEDGTISIAFGPQSQPIKINPGAITDPKELNTLTEDRSDRWRKMSEQYAKSYTFLSNMRELSAQATAQSDIGMIFSMVKMYDDGGRVTDADVQTVRNAPGVPEWVKNMYERAVNSQGPMFGPPGSITRQNFVKSAEALARVQRENLIPQGKFLLQGLVKMDGIAPEKVFTPAGDVTLEVLMGEEQASKEHLALQGNAPEQKVNQATVGAPLVPRQQDSAPAGERVRATKQSFNELMNNIFVVPPGQ